GCARTSRRISTRPPRWRGALAGVSLGRSAMGLRERMAGGGTKGGLGARAIQARVAELGEWFHNLDLDGVQTAPGHFLGDYPRCKWRAFEHALPARLDGKTVLDVGCNAGFYSLEMKRRGAARVLGIDEDETYLAQ